MRWLWCSHGERINRRPSAHASKRLPAGFVISVKPFSCKIISGKPASKAARITAFSPGEILGDTRTAPQRAFSRKKRFRISICSSLKLREHWTCRRKGCDNKKRLPIAENSHSPTFILRCTRKNSGQRRFVSKRRGLSRKYFSQLSSCPRRSSIPSV